MNILQSQKKSKKIKLKSILWHQVLSGPKPGRSLVFADHWATALSRTCTLMNFWRCCKNQPIRDSQVIRTLFPISSTPHTKIENYLSLFLELRKKLLIIQKNFVVVVQLVRYYNLTRLGSIFTKCTLKFTIYHCFHFDNLDINIILSIRQRCFFDLKKKE